MVFRGQSYHNFNKGTTPCFLIYYICQIIYTDDTDDSYKIITFTIIKLLQKIPEDLYCNI